MRALVDGHETPYMFHMCWTLGIYPSINLSILLSLILITTIDKKTKLENFYKVGMWYVRQEGVCESIHKTYALHKGVNHVYECCHTMDTAPFIHT
jgi:hypothetical protein